jgi:hypothetical protein
MLTDHSLRALNDVAEPEMLFLHEYDENILNNAPQGLNWKQWANELQNCCIPASNYSRVLKVVTNSPFALLIPLPRLQTIAMECAHCIPVCPFFFLTHKHTLWHKRTRHPFKTLSSPRFLPINPSPYLALLDMFHGRLSHRIIIRKHAIKQLRICRQTSVFSQPASTIRFIKLPSQANCWRFQLQWNGNLVAILLHNEICPEHA